MKKAIFAGMLLAVAGGTAAQSDYHVAFEITGNISVNNFSELELDLNIGDEFLTANGVMKSGIMAVPATGTCFFNTAGGVFCNLQVDQDSYSVDLSSTLTGTLIVKGANGAILDTAPIRLIDLY